MEYISSYELAKACNTIFSLEVTEDQFLKIQDKYSSIFEKKGNRVSYINSKIFLNDGDSIFAKTDNLNLLFNLLKKYPMVKNLKLITSQDDLKIDNQILRKLPPNINIWFSINIDTKSTKVFSIPLGLANNYDKNLNVEDYNEANFTNNFYDLKENLLYLNFNKNTNSKERGEIYDKFSAFSWVKSTNFNLLKEDYLNDLSSSNFVFCPPGNGIDTHRMWETLYAGSIPVVKKSYHTLSFSELPIFYYETFLDVSEESLLDFLHAQKKINLETLNLDYWKNKFLNDNLNLDKEIIEIEINRYKLYLFKLKYRFIKNLEHKRKVIFFRLNQIKNLFLQKD